MPHADMRLTPLLRQFDLLLPLAEPIPVASFLVKTVWATDTLLVRPRRPVFGRYGMATGKTLLIATLIQVRSDRYTLIEDKTLAFPTIIIRGNVLQI